MPPVPQTAAASSPSHPHLLAIRTPRLRLRTVQPRDAAAQRALNESAANTEHEPHSREGRPPGHYEAWIARQREAAARGANNFMVVALPGAAETQDPKTHEVTDDTVIGMTGFNAVRYAGDDGTLLPEDAQAGPKVAVDVGVMIDSQHWRKGYGREALAALIEFALAPSPDGWGADYVQMQTDHGNEKFLGLARSLGLAELGKKTPECVEWCFGSADWAAAKSGP